MGTNLKAAALLLAVLGSTLVVHYGDNLLESMEQPVVAQQPSKTVEERVSKPVDPPRSHHVVHAKIDGPDKVDAGDLVVLDSSGSEATTSRQWHWKHAVDASGKLIPEKSFLEVEGGQKIVFATGTPGQYTFMLVAVGLDNGKVDFDSTTFTFTVGGVLPPSPDPPPPGPTPPGPTPPGPAPIPADGLHALILYETDDRDDYTKSQNDILNSTKIRDFLDAKAKGRWRMWDDDIDMTNAPETWKKAMAEPRGALPWIMVSDGVKGEARTILPTDNEATILELLKKYSTP